MNKYNLNLNLGSEVLGSGSPDSGEGDDDNTEL